MKKAIGLVLIGLFLSGCAETVALLGPASTSSLTGGNIIQSATTSVVSYGVKKQTGKSPMEHILNPQQFKSYKATKAKLNPCEQTPELCSKINLRVAVINDILKNKSKFKVSENSN